MTERNRNEQEGSTQDQGTVSRQDLQNAPPGSSTLSSSPPTKAPSENPVNRIDRDAGDVVADKVREGNWNATQQERNDQRNG